MSNSHQSNFSELAIERVSHPGRLATVPSWLISAGLHVLLLFFFASSLKSCGQIPGAAEGDYRNVGIYIKNASDSLEQVESQDRNSDAESQVAPFPADNNVSKSAKSDSISDLLDLPPVTEQNLVIGPGVAATAPRSFVPGDVEDTIRSGGTRRPASLQADSGEVNFFGAKDRGSRFVYLLDSSGSMTSHNAIRVAKAEVSASLGSLESTQQFQIIFYNSNAQSMQHRSSASKMFWATDINRTLARQFIAGIQPAGGTNHMPALKKALRLNPQVIFFLTDADEPQLSAAELDEIRKLNRGRTHIHCIEFGTGSNLQTDNFLKKMAGQNGGTYQYRDVTKFNLR